VLTLNLSFVAISLSFLQDHLFTPPPLGALSFPLGLDGGRGFLLVLVGGLPRMCSPRACGLVAAGPDLSHGGCSRHHFERLGSNEVPGSDTN
jgi:hypothetical protein